MTARRLSHLNEAGEVRMVDVSAKAVTERSATAEGFESYGCKPLMPMQRLALGESGIRPW